MSRDTILYTYEYFMQGDICRFCWNKNAYSDIKTELGPGESKQGFIDKIKECLDIDLSFEDLPNKICEMCQSQVEKFYDFKKFCQEADQKLRDIMLENKSVKTEIQFQTSDFNDSMESPMDEPSIETKLVKTEAQLETSDFNDSLEVSVDEPLSHEDYDTPKKLKQIKYRKRRSPTFCNICFEEFNTTENLSKHRSEQHDIENGLYKCFGCEKRFRNRKLCLSHERLFCKALKNGYKCHICEKFLPDRRKFELHGRNHKRNVVVDLPDNIFKCACCMKTFNNRDKLNDHMNEHRSPRSFVCETCGRTFSRQDYLYKHMFTHTGIKKHACPYCTYRTTQKSGLNLHMRRHTGERPYSCAMCPQQCVSSGNLAAHMQKHLGVKKYECSACDKKFGYKKSLEEHVTSAHASQHHACECGAAYTRERSLRRHRAAKQCGRAEKNCAVTE